MTPKTRAALLADKIALLIYRRNPLAAGLDIVSTITPALVEALAPVSTAVWLPIETAPKDTDVLVVVDYSFRAIRVAHFYRDNSWRIVDAGADTIRPTHWMPLPAPPLPSDPPAEKDQ